MVHASAHRKRRRRCHCFSRGMALYSAAMTMISGWGGRVRGFFTDTKGPWGQNSSDAGGDPPSDDAQGGPWGEPPRRARRSGLGAGNVSAIEELLRRGRARFGGGGDGGGLPGRPAGSVVLWALLAA